MGKTKQKEKELTAFVIKRDSMVEQLNRFKSFFQSFDRSQYLQLPDRLKKCEGLWELYEEVQAKVESLLEDEADLELQREERVRFENEYFSVLAIGRGLLSDDRVDRRSEGSRLSDCHQVVNQPFSSQAKLPQIEIPKFNGTYDQWVPFYDIFFTMIHNCGSLSNIQKFYYLKGSLVGEAADVIHSLQITDENYEVAWSLLKERFENKRLIVNHYLNTLFNLTPLNKESPSQLRHFLDEVKKVLRVLKVLKQPVESWDTILIYMLSNKLDFVSKREWESSIITQKMPDIDTFFDFLTKRCQLLETLEQNRQSSRGNVASNARPDQNKSQFSFNKASKSFLTSNKSTFSCVFCKEAHLPFNCSKFLSWAPKARLSESRKQKLCLNCLRSNHSTQDCYGSSCRKCTKKHNTLLHIDDYKSDTNKQTVNNATNNDTHEAQLNKNSSTYTDKTSNSNITHTTESKREETSVCSAQTVANLATVSQVLLSTARLFINDKNGKQHECRALLDSGSQSNFITKELCSKLQLSKKNINIPVVGITQSVTKVSHITNTTISSRVTSFKANISCLVVDNITEDLPSVEISILSIPQGISLADPTYHSPGKIELLLGATLFYDLLITGQIKVNNRPPVIQNTKLGWVLSGMIPNNDSSRQTVCNFARQDIHQQVERFWRQEEVQKEKQRTREERKCEEIFQTTTSREKDGRFCVRLPMKVGSPELGESYNIAVARFENLERKLNGNSSYKELYQDFLSEYESLGHMSKIRVEEALDGSDSYYMPHHGIYRAASTTSRLRVVFDASSKTDNGISLNDKLLVGEKIQDDLFQILLRFRQYSYVMTADIEKMYRQINIAEDQRSLQRIVWRENPAEDIRVYQLNTVTYGTASAPFLAVRCLKQIALEIQNTEPEASEIIQRDFYMDDLLTGSNDLEGLKQLKSRVDEILRSYGFHLRKWLSNNSEVIEGTDPEYVQSNQLIMEDKVSKTLGVIWNASADTLQYTITAISETKGITKRQILAATAKIFDPLGLIGPTTIKAKILLQKLWQLNIGWDEEVPTDIQTLWLQISRQWQLLNHLRIPRMVVCVKAKQIELHCFSDASEQAYAACIYVRSIDANGKITVKLMCAKSRVAPLKQVSLPRLELNGALLVSQLADSVIKSLSIELSSVSFWTDSTIVLAWLAGEPTRWKTYVANRVAEIQDLTSNYKWYHVRSEDNPADVISRGLTPEQLTEYSTWWNGPHFLYSENIAKLNESNHQTLSDVPDQRKINTYLVSIQSNFYTELFKKYSSLIKLQRVLAYCLRFINNLKQNDIQKRRLNGLTVDELEVSLGMLVKACQEAEFPEEIKLLEKNKPVNRSSKLLPLTPFFDKDHCLRVGGRLNKSNLEFYQKHPLILPKNHLLTKLIILNYHYKYLHTGPQALLGIIRLKFWPISGRSTVRNILGKCLVCFRNKPRDIAELMGELPRDRVTPSRPFSIVGTDFAGPFKVRTSKLRGHKVIKVYMCIFICFVTKAVHIEIVSELSTDAFLNCFKRFVARRGLCSKIYSDNATNYVGAYNELQNLYDFLNNKTNQSILYDHFTNFNIEWKFIPARSPHFGGLWESAVKSAKFHIKRVVGESVLTFEELYTVFVQIEACLNSRPLIPLTENPDDIQALTPAHFLIGSSLVSLPSPDLTNETPNRLTRYQLLTQLIQSFWSKWSHEYLSILQPRKKWQVAGGCHIEPGTIVLLKEDQVPPNQWLLGRVTEVFKGSDDKVRVVNVKTRKGVFKRAITKLSILPIDDNST